MGAREYVTKRSCPCSRLAGILLTMLVLTSLCIFQQTNHWGLANMPLIKLKQFGRTLGLDLMQVSVAGNILIGAFEVQTGIQLDDLPEMASGYWSSWERCDLGLRHIASDFAVDV